MQRQNNRAYNQLRPISVVYGSFGYASGSVLFELGNTKVLCAVTLQKGVPPFLKGTKTGWLTAEYALLPTSTALRTQREASSFKRNGRSVEISRFIGRSLRAIVNLNFIGEQTIIIDCDVLQADGGTRTACLTGAYLALQAAEKHWLNMRIINEPVIKQALAAISVGIVNNQPYVDLNYDEDSKAEADFNFVLTSSGTVIEIQGVSEKDPISWEMFEQLRQLAQQGVAQLFQHYKLSVVSKNKDSKQEKAPLFSLQRRQVVLK